MSPVNEINHDLHIPCDTIPIYDSHSHPSSKHPSDTIACYNATTCKSPVIMLQITNMKIKTTLQITGYSGTTVRTTYHADNHRMSKD